ncbi:TIM barrel protein [Cohnella sp. CFH 77786]|uniref:sugar phosphate isomerase/epimerase family protein n=1 Tax=Cohnella sp. CFH 77786 TaxID=2662265 RepID=UPI001C608FDB|nr:sugar phosphate isomerase/epimerase family protein [Cohnella sp. CFH 77786]MBW5448519.1 TIM barrel protein [Cohnella sp. CFH 77786]
MKLGLSTYSLQGALDRKEMSVVDVIHWTAEQGGEHVEIVPLGYDLVGNPELAEEIVKAAKAAKIEISGYSIGANFAKEDPAEFEKEVAAVMRHVDVAHALGVKRMRHDVAFRKTEEASIEQFERDLPALVDACRRIADYASAFGITTSVENHGYYVQASDRVRRLVHEVNRPNFRTTLDIGNFMCVDEDPLSAVKNNAPLASMVHVKDFYRRPASYNPGEGWFRSAYGHYLRGAIAGQGDLPVAELLRIVKQSGYDGYLSVEFEGMEDCRTGSRIALNNVRRLWAEA